jgi:hypothetical protein
VRDEPRAVYEFAKNTREVVRASLVTFGGHELADLRVHVADRPTRKGLTLRVVDLPELRNAVEALIAALEAEEASQ